MPYKRVFSNLILGPITFPPNQSTPFPYPHLQIKRRGTEKKVSFSIGSNDILWPTLKLTAVSTFILKAVYKFHNLKWIKREVSKETAVLRRLGYYKIICFYQLSP